jgi:hypothetical protein
VRQDIGNVNGKRVEKVDSKSEKPKYESEHIIDRKTSTRSSCHEDVGLITSERVDGVEWNEVSRLLDKIYFSVSIVFVTIMLGINIFIFREKFSALF